MALDYIEIVHSGNPITFPAFISRYLITLDEEFKNTDLFLYEKNNERIWESLTKAQKKEINNSSGSVSSWVEAMLITSGVLIRIPKDKIDREIISLESNQVIPNSDFSAFIDDRIKEIIEDDNYKPIALKDTQTALGKISRHNNECSVWIWCKGLGTTKESGKLLNITPFVHSLTTTVGDTGGNFTVEVSPLMASYFKEDGGSWGIKLNTAFQYAYNGVLNTIVRNSDKYIEKDEYRSGKDFFHTVLRSNDVVFLKFETLEIDKKLRDLEKSDITLQELILPESALSDGTGKDNRQLFDMIGLVDKNTLSHDSTKADRTVKIVGRDLMKLLLEDGEYFFPTDLNGDAAGNIQGSSGASKFRIVSGEALYFNGFVDRTIDFSLKFIFNLLSNIKVCSETLFQGYEDKSTKYEFHEAIEGGEELQQVPLEGIWQAVKIVIDPELSDRKIVDSSLMSDQGSLFSYVSGKVIQQPFGEFYGDTYGNKYYFIARKPPFDKKSYSSLAQKAIDIDADEQSVNLSFDDDEVFSWFRVEPTGNYFGGDDSIAISLFPAIYFQEYAEIWGSRPYVVKSNYIDYEGFVGKEDQKQKGLMDEQSTNDLSYIIECNAYKPFTRKGTITLARGDRRIKRGMCVRLKSTGEIFHVDSVTNTFAVTENFTDRMTTLQVSRGMVEEYIEGRSENIHTDSGIKGYKVSYFDIIDLKKDENGIPTSNDFKVQKPIFDFFMKGLQFKL